MTVESRVRLLVFALLFANLAIWGARQLLS